MYMETESSTFSVQAIFIKDAKAFETCLEQDAFPFCADSSKVSSYFGYLAPDNC